jgi:tRNA threonylcarbamoyladenosine biosynthesis protein TsaB
MLTLAVDTSTRIGSLALLRDRELLGEVSNADPEPYSSGLFADLNKLMGDLGLSLKQVDLFAVAAGPGSFTGLRVGLTAVKAWAEVYGKPIAPVSGLEAVAALIAKPPGKAHAGSQGHGRLLIPVMDARRGQLFGAMYERRFRNGVSDSSYLKRIGDEVVMGAAEFLELVAARVVNGSSQGAIPQFASPSPEVIQSVLAQSRFGALTVEKVPGVLAAVIGRLGYESALRGDAIDALHLDANYVRRTDAESKWKES